VILLPLPVLHVERERKKRRELLHRLRRVLSREFLMDLVKGEALEAFDRSIDVHVSRLRAAIEDDPRRPRRIITVRGSGYVFAKAQD